MKTKTRADFKCDMSGVTYAVPNLIGYRMFNLIIGRPGTIKSWTIDELARAGLTGTPFLGHFPCEKFTDVIYIDEDQPRNISEERLDMIFHNGRNPVGLDTRFMTGFDLGDNATVTYLCNRIRGRNTQGGEVLVLLDSLAKLSKGRNLGQTHIVGKIIGNILRIRDAGATVVVVHHVSIHSDSKEPMENTQIKASCDTCLYFEEVKMPNRIIAKVEAQGRRIAVKGDPFFIELTTTDTQASLKVLSGQWNTVTDVHRDIYSLYHACPLDAFTVQSIHDRMGARHGLNAIRAAMPDLVEQKVLKQEIGKSTKAGNAILQFKLHKDFPNLTSEFKDALKA